MNPRRRGPVGGENGARTPSNPVGRIGSERGPPNLPTETIAPSCPRSVGNSPSPVPIGLRPLSARPRESAAFSGMVTGNGREVSAPADYLAVRAGESEPVSGGDSLISWENTGNSAGFAAIAPPSRPGRRPVPGPCGAISLDPGAGNAVPGSRDQPGFWRASPSIRTVETRLQNQSSTRSPLTRSKCLRLCVTRARPRESAWAATIVSSTPIGTPASRRTAASRP